MTNIFNTGDDIEVLEEACNAEFPKLYIDKLTTLYFVNEGLLDEWPYGPINWCCKIDADVVVDYPPDFPSESCALCWGPMRTDFFLELENLLAWHHVNNTTGCLSTAHMTLNCPPSLEFLYLHLSQSTDIINIFIIKNSYY